jgi:hypothetical protein
MNSRAAVFLAVLFVAWTSAVSSGQTGARAKSIWQGLADDLESPVAIKSIGVFWTPKHVSANAPLTSADIEQRSLCRIHVDTRILGASALASVLRRTASEPSNAPPNYRWAISFDYTDGGHKVLCLDASGSNGEVAGMRFRLRNAALIQYLEGIGKALGY